MDTPENWKISMEERLKHNASFMQLNPINGNLLTGKSFCNKGFLAISPRHWSALIPGFAV